MSSSSEKVSSVPGAELQNQIREAVRVLLEGLIKGVVQDPSSVKVRYQVGERTTQFFVECNIVEIGRVIGAKGRTIGAIRVLVASMMGNHGMRSIVEIPYHSPKSSL